MKTLAIVGATGLVGESFIKILNKTTPSLNYLLFASAKSVGTKIKIHNKTYTVQSIDTLHQHKFDYAVFMTDNKISRTYIPIALSQGAKVIDNSSTYRMENNVPLVIDCVNGELIANNSLIANPNCTTIQIAIVLSQLRSLQPVRIAVSTYQAVSGAGKNALNDLYYNTTYGSLSGLMHPIYNNVIPHIDEFCPDGYTKEEHKVINEMKKILDFPQLKVTCTAVRVPVSVGHSVVANIQFEQDFELDDIRALLNSHPLITVVDDTAHNLYPMPITAQNTPYVYVGRMRKDISQPNTLECFIVADNLLRGASYNAYEILMRVMENDKD